MTPQENDLVNTLFDRLARLESAPRDAGAERLIADGLRRAPHAVYALVQTALVQDEALKRANARIEELQAQANEQASKAVPAEPPPSFLDNMRDAFGGRAAAHGSVPSVRPPTPGNQPQTPQAQSQSIQPQGQNFQGDEPQPGYPPPPPGGYPSGAAAGSGGSFLGNAASAAAGVIGGAFLLDGIRSMFGHRPGGLGSSPLGGFTDNRSSPWSNAAERGDANNDLARDLGAKQIDSRDDNARDDQPADADSFTDTDDVYNADDTDDDDSDDSDDDDFDGDDSGDDSYDA
jgi:uncharacterized protein